MGYGGIGWSHPVRKLEVDHPQLPGFPKRPDAQLVAPPHLVADLTGRVFVVEVLVLRKVQSQLVLDVFGQRYPRRLVAGQESETFYVEDEVFGRALSPLRGVGGRRESVVAAVHFDDREL